MTEFKIRFSILSNDNHSEALSIERLFPLLSSEFFNELVSCEQQLVHQAATSIVQNEFELTSSHLDSPSISIKVDISK